MTNINERSDQIWRAMKKRDTKALKQYIHPHATFVHMGATMTGEQELKTIRQGKIIYQDIETKDKQYYIYGETSILLHHLILTAIVGDKKVTNTFVVTEVYNQVSDNLQLISMSFTKILY